MEYSTTEPRVQQYDIVEKDNMKLMVTRIVDGIPYGCTRTMDPIIIHGKSPFILGREAKIDPPYKIYKAPKTRVGIEDIDKKLEYRHTPIGTKVFLVRKEHVNNAIIGAKIIPAKIVTYKRLSRGVVAVFTAIGNAKVELEEGPYVSFSNLDDAIQAIS